jgi:signal transduction histidine kinase/CheY-like chemotaxis protein
VSISRQLAFFFVISWIITVLVLGWLLITFRVSQTEALLIESEQQVVSQHAREIQVRFDEIPKAHAAAHELQSFWYENLSQADVEDKFAAAFERQADGTWRSRDLLFEGTHNPVLGHVGGIAAFIATTPVDASRKRELVSVLASITALAPGQRHFLESLWYVSPHGDILIFAPDREDKLAFYRRLAPADSDFTALPFIKAVMPDLNPAGRTLCTNLSRAVYDTTGETLITSCQTPTPTRTGEVGVWGTSLLMNQRLKDMVGQGAGARTLALAASDGTLIAGPGILTNEGAPADLLAKVMDDLRWSSIMPALKDQAGTGFINQPDLPWLVTFARVAGPDWLLVYFRDRNLIAQQLSADLPLLGLMALLLLMMQVVVVLVFVRRRISLPLQKIASRYTAGSKQALSASGATGLPAEILALEQQLSTAWAEVASLVQGLEERVMDRTAELSAALKVAESANQAVNVFLANVSHEIRTPLNGVVALSGVLLKSDLSKQQREMAKIIQASSESLKLVVSDILDASKLEAGRLDLTVDTFNLKTVIEEASHAFAVAAQDKGLSFVIDYHPSAHGEFLGDAHRIKQILGNLSSNAVKFTDNGEVRITVRAEVSGNENVTLVEVCDTGIGFDSTFSERIFGRFEQSDNSLTRRFGGTGLGLSISRALAELMGGSLTAHSEPGVGSRFILSLPLQPAASAARSANDLTNGLDQPRTDENGRRALKVLVVEDHARNREVMTILLEQIDAIPTCVANGADAIMRFASDRYDLILMDMQMPDIDGLEVTRRMRDREHQLGLLRTPIIMVTANTLPEHAARAIAAGCDAHLAKPVTPEALYSLIAALTQGADNSALAEAG